MAAFFFPPFFFPLDPVNHESISLSSFFFLSTTMPSSTFGADLVSSTLVSSFVRDLR